MASGCQSSPSSAGAWSRSHTTQRWVGPPAAEGVCRVCSRNIVLQVLACVQGTRVRPPNRPSLTLPGRPQDEWTVTGAGGQSFDPVDLREDWADYDEKLGDSVSIMGVEAKFELHKGK